jgi:4'-phosphopantetheinyl transferase
MLIKKSISFGFIHHTNKWLLWLRYVCFNGSESTIQSLLMNHNFTIDHNTVHIWRLFLPDFTTEIHQLSTLLNHLEQDRAHRFHFPIHQERFTITHGLLRKTLGLYLDVDPKALTFHHGEHGKPYLANHAINFNISHSHDMALFALTHHKEIGVDIEKMEPSFKESVAKRFFSPAEYADLMQLPETDRVVAFYKIWSRKEAFIKVLGKGLFTPLDSFSVSHQKDSQSIVSNTKHYVVKNININAAYQAAFAAAVPVTEMTEWEWVSNKPNKISVNYLK